METIAERVATLGLDLPEPTVPQGSYTPFVQSGALLFVAGQGPRLNGQLVFKGTLGGDLGLEDGIAAARICGLNLLRQVSEATGGDLAAVTRVVRLSGVVRCVAEFEQHAAVINGASDLMRDVFGERGIHARMAIGTHALPSGMAVEIEGVFELRA